MGVFQAGLFWNFLHPCLVGPRTKACEGLLGLRPTVFLTPAAEAAHACVATWPPRGPAATSPQGEQGRLRLPRAVEGRIVAWTPFHKNTFPGSS